MAAIQVNMRVPDDLLSRIDASCGAGERSKWILEACRMRLDGGWPCEVRESGLKPEPSIADEGSTPSPSANPAMQALRDICAGKIAGPVAADTQEAPPRQQEEIPICGKTWWEDGEHYECLMDAGHREQKHGLRGMVRWLDE